jgi:hypothetical protein
MNNDEVLDGTFDVVMSVQGPIGKTGAKGDPAFIQFHIDNGCLIVEQAFDNYTFRIVGDELIVIF